MHIIIIIYVIICGLFVPTASFLILSGLQADIYLDIGIITAVVIVAVIGFALIGMAEQQTGKCEHFLKTKFTFETLIRKDNTSHLLLSIILETIKKI